MLNATPDRSLHGRRYDTGELVRIDISGGLIQRVEAAPAPAAQQDEVRWIAPALFDLQVNGYGGVWFGDAGLTTARIAGVCEAFLPAGVTRILPTVITQSFAALRDAFVSLERACREVPWIEQFAPGYHLEGPYISPEDGYRGAHPSAHVRPPDWDEFCRLQDAAAGRIRLITLAAEWPTAPDFIRRAVDLGVAVALGHTAAHRDQISAAVDAGASLSTHLGNGCRATLPRHPNCLWDQLDEPRLAASLITDGQHVPSSFVRVVLRCKSADRVVVTSDASGWAGLQPGTYGNALGAVDVLDDGRIAVSGQAQYLAGSGARTDVCVARLRHMADLSWREAIDAAGCIPCGLLGLPVIRLTPGSRADLIVFEERPAPAGWRIVATLVGGEVRFGQL